ncbi:MAG: leucine--tRNA ligase [Eubacteriales bacterium]
MQYEFTKIEEKWRKIWEETRAFASDNHSDKEKFYALVEFPYPSGAGLHVGHARPYTAMDVVARKRRMDGQNVLFPMGYDAFGLPTENFAIKNKIHPATVTRNNVANFRKQLEALGYSFDWSREINTTDPEYFKWTQWIFLKLFENGLAYKSMMPVNWCTNCKIVKANEEVVDGACELCGGEVIQKEKSQWMLAITKYAQRLIDDLDGLDFIDRVKAQQKNWIGRSTGAEVTFTTSNKDNLVVFTSRPDTLFGVTYMVISPEHPCLATWKAVLENDEEIQAYAEEAKRKSNFERSELAKEKTGIKIKGVTAINPVNGTEIPIFVSDYVLMSYGTGAIMAVPAHDQRDWEFAQKFDCSIIEVVAGGNVAEEAFTTKDDKAVLVNSDFLDGKTVKEAISFMTKWLTEKNLGEEKVNYKLRDWIFSRQRYWGEPIPLVDCPHCGFVPIPESELPLTLPEVDSYEPTDTGESPLAAMTEWVNTTCPKCGKEAKRETDTMPQWAGSSWYFLRYMDPDCKTALASEEALKYWSPVDWYNGGMEHTTLHLLYSRFWHKFLFDIGVVPTTEPYAKRTSHGMILGEDGRKMSKSLGNVINPSDIIAECGADTMRTYIMFIGDFEKAASWSQKGVLGCKRFLDRVWKLAEEERTGDDYSPTHEAAIHKAIKKVADDIEAMKFNTAIACLMALVNDFYATAPSRGDMKALLTLLSPFAPHLCEEQWEKYAFGGSVCATPWPEYDQSKTISATTPMGVQVGGKLKASIEVPTEATEEEIVQIALADEKISKIAQGMTLVKSIVVKGRLVNLIFKNA